MAKNYFEHKTEVKYVDNLLSKSTDWDWYIDYVEENFDIDISIKSSLEFRRVFAEVAPVFQHLIKIHEIIDVLNFHKEWLIDIDQLALFYIGKIDIEKLTTKNDFMRLFALYIFSAKIINEKSDTKYLIYTEIFNNYNVFEIIDTTYFSTERDIIFRLIEQLNIDFGKEKEIFKENVNRIFHRCEKVSEPLLEICNSPNSFSSSNPRKSDIVDTWEERYLWDLICVNYRKGKFIPTVEYRGGNTFPDFSIYTPEVLSKIKQYFYDTDVMFLVESVEYVLTGNIPSQKTIDKHFELFERNANDYDDEKGWLHLHCSSLEFILSFFEDNHINTRDKLAVFSISISKINNIKYLSYLQSRNAPITKKVAKTLKEYRAEKVKQIDDISDSRALEEYMTDEDIISVIDKDIFYKVSDKFEYVLENIAEGASVEISSLFLKYLLLLIKVKNNRNIIPNEISTEIIYIRNLWQEKYFNVCSKSLNCISDSIQIPTVEVDKHNSNIINNPIACACSALSMKEDVLIKNMENTSEHPLLNLVTHITIAEDFPLIKKIYLDGGHPIDMIIKTELKRIYDDNAYKFLNQLRIEEFMDGLYKYIKGTINIYLSLFNETEKLYDKVCNDNPEYRFIAYSEKPTLAHLTQLFPMIERKVRKIGEFFGISPICENIDKYHKLKEPYSVLHKIINFIYEETKQLSYASDFIFVHFALFAENGLNIRNDCIHGNGYNISDSEIMYAFKITLFCLNLLEYRMGLMLGKH